MKPYSYIVLFIILFFATSCNQAHDVTENNSTNIPVPGDYGAFSAGEINPYPQIRVQIAQSQTAASTEITFIYDGKTYVRTINNLQKSDTFISGTPANFFNAPDLKLIVGKTYVADVVFKNADGKIVGTASHIAREIPSTKLPSVALFVVMNEEVR